MKSFFGKFALIAAIAISFVTNFKAQAADKPLSPSVAEVVRLQKAGTPEEVMLAYVRNSTSALLNSEEVLYLHDAGVSKTVIMAMLKKPRQLPQAVESAPAATHIGSGRVLAKPEWEQSANAAQAPAVPEPSTTGTATSETAAKSAPVVTAPLTPPAATPTAPVYVTAPPVVSPYYAPGYYPYYGYYDWYRPSISIGFGFGSYWGHGHHYHGYHGHGHGIHYRGGGHH